MKKVLCMMLCGAFLAASTPYASHAEVAAGVSDVANLNALHSAYAHDVAQVSVALAEDLAVESIDALPLVVALESTEVAVFELGLIDISGAAPGIPFAIAMQPVGARLQFIETHSRSGLPRSRSTTFDRAV